LSLSAIGACACAYFLNSPRVFQPLDFDIFNKKGCFPGFEWKKMKKNHFGSPWKNFGEIP